MATIAVLMGGITGFIGFLTGLIAFDLSLASASILYAATGCATILLAFAIRYWPAAGDQSEAQPA